MILPGIFLAFLVGLVVEAAMLAWLDRRSVRREAQFWEELRAEAMQGYGRVFDWEKDL